MTTSFEGQCESRVYVKVTDHELAKSLKGRFVGDFFPGCGVVDRNGYGKIEQPYWESSEDFNHGRETITRKERTLTPDELVIWKWLCAIETGETEKRLRIKKEEQEKREKEAQALREVERVEREKKTLAELKAKYEGQV